MIFSNKAGFPELIDSTGSVLRENFEIGCLDIEGIDGVKLVNRLFNQGGPFDVFTKKLSLEERKQYVDILKQHKKKIDIGLQGYAMHSVLNDFMTGFWFKNGKKVEEDFDPELFRELISLDLPHINFNQYQTSRGTTIQSIINRLYTLAKQNKTNKEDPLQKFLWNYLRKEITYCETLHDMMSSLPTHPAVAEIKQVLKPNPTVDLPSVIDRLLQGQLTTEELKLYYPLLVQQREVIDPIIKKYLWAARSSKKAFPWYTGFMNNFWFKDKQKQSRFDEEHYEFNESKGADYDLSAFWKIIEHGLTAKDFANIATVDNEHVREAIALMHGKDKVYPFANGYAMIANRDKNYSGFHPTAIGFIDTNFNRVSGCSYVDAKDIQPDGTVEVAVNGESVDGPDGQSGHQKLIRSTISLKKEPAVK